MTVKPHEKFVPARHHPDCLNCTHPWVSHCLQHSVQVAAGKNKVGDCVTGARTGQPCGCVGYSEVA